MVKKKGQKSKKNAALSAAVDAAEQKEVEQKMKVVDVSDEPGEPLGESKVMATACSSTMEEFDEEVVQMDEPQESTKAEDSGITTCSVILISFFNSSPTNNTTTLAYFSDC